MLALLNELKMNTPCQHFVVVKVSACIGNVSEVYLGPCRSVHVNPSFI